MTRSRTTYKFIHICNEDNHIRLSLLAKNLGLAVKKLEPFKVEIDWMMEFIKAMDEQVHQYESSDIGTAFGQALHISASSDLRSLIVLATNYQNFQMNIILRHFIEVFVVVLWIDIGSQFTGSFDYFLSSRMWKPYRQKHRVYWDSKDYPDRSIKQCLASFVMLYSAINK